MKKAEIQSLDLKQIKNLLDEKNLLEFNRTIKPLHVKKMADSIEQCGILRLPVIADVSSFDKRGLVIADGQHLLQAVVNLSATDKTIKDIACIFKTYQNKRELINDISILNNTQKSWNDDEFLSAWYKYGKDNVEHFYYYSKLYQYRNDFSLPPALLIDIFSDSKDKFRTGSLSFRDEEFSTKLMQVCEMLKVNFDSPTHTLHGLRMWAQDRYFKQKKDIDWSKLNSRLKSKISDKKSLASEGRDDFFDTVDRLYKLV